MTSLWNLGSVSNDSKKDTAPPDQKNNSVNFLLSGVRRGMINIVVGGGGADENPDAVEVEAEDPSRPVPSSLIQRWYSGDTTTSKTTNDSTNSSSRKIQDTTTSVSTKSIQLKKSVSFHGPSLYEEALEMLSAALLIYTFADLRKLVREGKIQAKELMQQPISLKQVTEAIRTHREALEEEAKIDHDELEAQLKALKDIQKHQLSSTTSVLGRILRGGSSKKEESVLAHFHDEKSTQGMVYGIAVNHIRKRITAIFRGSVTPQDFVTDVKLAQKKVDNPVLPLAPEISKTVNIHTGFYQYLFHKDDEGKVRFEHIIDDVKALMKQNKGYQLYCTGHSLGGALATLCGFYAATDEMIVKNGPVVVVSIASPRVGNADFRIAFQTLEKTKRIKHLRVSNREDTVSLVPFVAIKEVTLSPSLLLPTNALLAPTNSAINLYQHCGIHLKFKSSNPDDSDDEKKLFSLTYIKDKDDEEGYLPDEVRRSMVAAKSLVGSLLNTRADFRRLVRFHCCDEYERRIMMSKNFLDNISLDMLYADESLVGGKVAIKETPIPDSSSSSRSLFGKKKSTKSLKSTTSRREIISVA